MSTVFPEIRLHRILGVAAVVHAGLLFAAMWYVLAAEPWGWPIRLWVGLTTLWFFWPIILAFHAGSSARRAYCALAVAAVLLALPMRPYLDFVGPYFLLRNSSVNLSPYTLGPFITGYVRGWAEAKQRVGVEPIILEGYGMGGDFTPGAPPFSKTALEKYRLHIKPIALCVVNPYIEGHAKGYNTASVHEIKRRHGSVVITAAEKEDAERQAHWNSERARGNTDAENDARAGCLAILLYQSVKEGEDTYREMFRERYQTELKRVATSSQEISETDLQYVWGYNEAARRELARKFGDEAQSAVWSVDSESFQSFTRHVEWQRSRAAK